ncbi:hypothetical protein J2T13_000886 [Paenibacillus sp. DS2015]|uniref:phage holin family protein n=1 Tax=Paenibacillus sp. DS2015 TaxID=3373917 RepID=UPI003D208AC3
MEWSAILEFISAELMVVVIACWVIGYILKQTPKVLDWTIVYIVTVFAVVFAVFLLGFTVQAILQGIMCGAVAVYGNQLVKQVKKSGADE